jgi:DNA-binding HxlR family transcriptional regulator
MQCPIARTLERVGDWWSLLILRDAMFGLSRFDEFRRSLGISPNILSRRLKQLVENGILERRVERGPPVRVDYALTDEGRAFQPMLLLLTSFGNKLYAKEGEAASVVHRKTGRAADIRVIDKSSGLEVTWPEFHLVPGPAATAKMKDKLAAANRMLGKAADRTGIERKALRKANQR